MSLDLRLLNLLVCPLCKGPLELLRDGEGQPQELACAADRLAFPIRDGLPVMLEHEARALGPRNADPQVPAPASAATPSDAPPHTPPHTP